MNTQVLLEVIAFATKAHAGQVRKYSGEPYIVHPIAVAKLVDEYWEYAMNPYFPPLYQGDPRDRYRGLKECAIQAAILHDVVEDTKIALDEIKLYFGVVVADIVDDLTKKTTKRDGNRAERCALERDRLAKVNLQSQFIKICDLIHNTRDIAANDPKFAKTYLQEKLDLLEVLLPNTQFNADIRADIKILLERE